MIDHEGHGLFFGVGTGRCGTMWLARTLTGRTDTVALHEGKADVGGADERKILPYLTLQNLSAYNDPRDAPRMLEKTRGHMPVVAEEFGCAAFGDIAYNLAPFVANLFDRFPKARLVTLYRDGRTFVRSAYTREQPDPTPVGWPDADKPLSRQERYIALGRLRPSGSDPVAADWDRLSPVGKNAWLWAETNRLILRGLEAWPRGQVLELFFEDLVANPIATYRRVCNFLDLETDDASATGARLGDPVNTRAEKVLPPPPDWDAATKAEFDRFASDMMARLGYY